MPLFKPGYLHDAKINSNNKILNNELSITYQNLLQRSCDIASCIIGGPTYSLNSHCMQEYGSNIQVVWNNT